MKGIILTSHGNLANGLLDTLSIFSGDLKQIETVCLMPSEDITEFLTRLKDAINTVDTGDGVVIFCDLLFGTPCNCCARLFNDPLFSNRVNVFTGMNLSIVLEYIGAREDKINSDNLINVGKEGIVDFNILFESRK